ncbi:MAG: FYDLN acid domain-containing protein [Pseudomonadota bacterium]
MLTKPRNLGTRRVCSACSTKYYDLNRSEPTCPKCGAPADAEEYQDPRAVAMARLKAENSRIRRADDEEELPFGLNEEEEQAVEDDEIDEFGEFTEDTSDDDDDDEEEEGEEAEFEEFED